MHRSNTVQQPSLSYGRALGGTISILGVLVVLVPVVGILLAPFVVLATVARAIRDDAAELAPKKGWMTLLRS